MKKLSVIIPVFNEEATIKEILKKVSKVELGKIKKEIIVIDDGSTDSSKLKISIFKRTLKDKRSFKTIFHKENQGKGEAIKSGLKEVTGDYVIIQDADLEYDPEDYKKMIKPIKEGKAEVVYGSRFTGERRNMFFWHMLANRFLSLLTNILFNTTLSDMENCYKMDTLKLLKELNLKSRSFDFEPEVTAKILKKRIRIYEVPISYAGREYEEGKKITWQDGLIALWTLLKYRFIV